MEDRDFKSMMDEREAGKARGPPASSHFTKMQNATIWGVKPNVMGEGKDWVMPENVPEAKANSEHIEKDDTIKDAKPAETTSSASTSGVSPLEGVGNLMTKKSESMPTFKEMMAFKKGLSEDISYKNIEGKIPQPKEKKLPEREKGATEDNGDGGFPERLPSSQGEARSLGYM